MFGKFRDSSQPKKTEAPSKFRVRSIADFGFEPDASVPVSDKPAATYDRLGVTLVGTPTSASLSGADAAKLASELCQKIHEAHHDPASRGGIKHVVLDLQNVQYMDSMCVGVLVELLTALKEAGGRIALVNASANVEYLFKLTRLDRVFPICRDVMKAIEVVERPAA